MSVIEIERVTQAWEALPILRVPHDESEYDALVQWLDDLIDIAGNNEGHPLASLMDVIGTLIESYEDATLPTFVA